MKTEIRLSVVIPARNAGTELPVQLLALAEQDWPEPFEVIVADNGSHDETVKVAMSFISRLPHLRVVDAERSRWAGACAQSRHRSGRGGIRALPRCR